MREIWGGLISFIDTLIYRILYYFYNRKALDIVDIVYTLLFVSIVIYLYEFLTLLYILLCVLILIRSIKMLRGIYLKNNKKANSRKAIILSYAVERERVIAKGVLKGKYTNLGDFKIIDYYTSKSYKENVDKSKRDYIAYLKEKSKIKEY